MGRGLLIDIPRDGYRLPGDQPSPWNANHLPAYASIVLCLPNKLKSQCCKFLLIAATNFAEAKESAMQPTIPQPAILGLHLALQNKLH